MAYRYEAYTLDKRIVRGRIDASSEKVAEKILYGEGYSRVLRLKEIGSGTTRERWLPSIFGVKTQDVIEYSRQLATLLDSGMPIITALGLLEKQTSKVALRRVISGLSTGLQGGSPFSQALRKFSRVFSPIYCQVIEAGEYTGNLAVALRQAAGYLEKNLVMTARVRNALAYPALVLLMAFGVVALITNVALPPLLRLFTSLGAELPWMTRLLIFSADTVAGGWFFILGGLLTAVMLALGGTRLAAGKRARDRLFLKIPLAGHVIILRNMTQFCHTASLLLEAGIPLPQIMNIVIGTVNNGIIRRALVDVRQKLVQGQGLSRPMAQNALFPELLVEMVVVGEKTGTLQSTLATLSDFYEQAVDQKVRFLTAALQHSLIVIIGAVVGFIGIAMVTPLYSILRAIH